MPQSNQKVQMDAKTMAIVYKEIERLIGNIREDEQNNRHHMPSPVTELTALLKRLENLEKGQTTTNFLVLERYHNATK